MKIKILLIDDEPLFRLGVKSALEDAGLFQPLWERETAKAGLILYREKRPDVVLLSLRLKETCAIDDIKLFRGEFPEAKIIILAHNAADGEISKSLRQGAMGYILKDIEPEKLVEALLIVNSGRKFIPPNVAEIVSEHLGMEDLTPAEQSVLRMLVGGMSNKEIAFGLDISENTVKTHLKNVFDKLGVSDRTAAATSAIKRGLVRVNL